MKIDENIRKALIKNLRGYRDKTVKWYDEIIRDIEHCSSVEDIMHHKKRLLMFLLDSCFPLSGNVCYFCMAHVTCRDCEYGKIHGGCDEDDNSDYAQLLESLRALACSFSERYYRGERYD